MNLLFMARGSQIQSRFHIENVITCFLCHRKKCYFLSQLACDTASVAFVLLHSFIHSRCAFNVLCVLNFKRNYSVLSSLWKRAHTKHVVNSHKCRVRKCIFIIIIIMVIMITTEHGWSPVMLSWSWSAHNGIFDLLHQCTSDELVCDVSERARIRSRKRKAILMILKRW